MAVETEVATQVARSVFAIHITPVKAALSLPSRKLHIAMAKLAGEQFRQLGRDKREEIEQRVRDYVAQLRSGLTPEAPVVLLQPRFHAKLSELAQLVGYFDPGQARKLWPALEQLQATQVRFNSLRHNAQRKEKELFPDELEVATSLLASVVRTGRGVVSWAYDPVILSIMVSPRTFAMLNLELVRNARTYTALALYENCRRFVGIGRAGPFPFRRWQELLAPDGKVPAWEDQHEFMRKVRRAIAELDACEGCDVAIEPERVNLPELGACLQFKVKALDQDRLPFGIPLPTNRELVDRLVAIGFTATEANVLLDTHGEEALHRWLAIMAKQRSITDPLAWMRAAIARDFNDDEVRRQQEAAKARAREEKLQRAAQLKQAFLDYQAERLRVRFSQAEEDVQVRWEVAFADSDAGHAVADLGPKAKEGAFYGWLAKQDHGLFEDPEESDFAVFALSQASAPVGASSTSSAGTRGGGSLSTRPSEPPETRGR